MSGWPREVKLFGMPKVGLSSSAGSFSIFRYQKDMEQSLKESERFWRTLLEAVGVGLMVIDKTNGRITEVNPQAVAMSGYSREQIVGQDRQRFFICPLKPEIISNTPSVRKNYSEEKLVKVDGTLIPILQTVAPFKLVKVHYLLVSFVYITDQRQADTALTKANNDLQKAMAEVGQTNKEIGLMSKMVELLQICQSPDEAYPIIGQYAQELFPDSSGALFVINSSNNLVSSVSQWGSILFEEKIFWPHRMLGLAPGETLSLRHSFGYSF